MFTHYLFIIYVIMFSLNNVKIKLFHCHYIFTIPNSRKHVCVYLRVCGCVGGWVCGCVGVWVCGCVGVWVCGCVGVWVCGSWHSVVKIR